MSMLSKIATERSGHGPECQPTANSHGRWRHGRSAVCQCRTSLARFSSGGDTRWGQQWHPDDRRFLPFKSYFDTIAYDTQRHQRLGTLFPQIVTRPDPAAAEKRAWLCIGPTGHVRGGPIDFRPIDVAKFPPEGNTPESLATIEDLIVYVAMLEEGSQQTFTPKQFAEKFNWTNDSNKATLSKLQD